MPQIFWFEAPRKGAFARGTLRGQEMTVAAGSVLAKTVAPSLTRFYRDLRERLIRRGVIALVGDQLVFTCDYPFSSPSTAANVIEGNMRNGYERWKDIDGKSMNAHGYRRSL